MAKIITKFDPMAPLPIMPLEGTEGSAMGFMEQAREFEQQFETAMSALDADIRKGSAPKSQLERLLERSLKQKEEEEEEEE